MGTWPQLRKNYQLEILSVRMESGPVKMDYIKGILSFIAYES